MSYIADKKEKCPGFFLVAILHTTCRVDKLLGFCLKNEFRRAAKEKKDYAVCWGFFFVVVGFGGVFCFVFGFVSFSFFFF